MKKQSPVLLTTTLCLLNLSYRYFSRNDYHHALQLARACCKMLTQVKHDKTSKKRLINSLDRQFERIEAAIATDAAAFELPGNFEFTQASCSG